MEIRSPGVAASGQHTTQGPKVQFTFVHRGQAFVQMRVSWQAAKSILHPLPKSDGQPKPRDMAPGSHDMVVQVSAGDLPNMPKTIDSDLLINGVLVVQATGTMDKTQTEDHGLTLFRLEVV